MSGAYGMRHGVWVRWLRALLLGLPLLLALSCCGAAQAPQAAQPEGPRSALSIVTSDGEQRFSVEVVTTPEAQSRGLMFRERMAADAGMLFPFGRDAPRSFWMKNTKLPLDILFIRSTGEIVAIAENTVPYSLRPIAPREPAAAVLELNAGTVARLGIRRGDRVRHPAIAGGR